MKFLGKFFLTVLLGVLCSIYIYGANWLESEWEAAVGWPDADDSEELFMELYEEWEAAVDREVTVMGLTYQLLKDGKTCRFIFPDDILDQTSPLNIPETISYGGKKYTVTVIDNSGWNGEGLGDLKLDLEGSALKTLTFPRTITCIYEPLNYYSVWTAFNVASGSNYFKAKDGVLYSADGKTLFQYPSGKAGNGFSIPSTVVSLADDAFLLCTFLKTVEIPSSVVDLGRSTFWGCEGLTHLTIPDNITALRGTMFGECSALQYLVIGDGVNYIDNELLGWYYDEEEDSFWFGDDDWDTSFNGLTIYTDNEYVKSWFIWAMRKSGDVFFIRPRSEAPGYVPTPVAPQPTATTDLNDGITVMWDAVSGAVKYKVCRGTTSNYSNSTVMNTVTSTSYRDTSASVGTTYYYWVVPVDSSNKEYSNATKYATGRRVKAPVVLSPPMPTASSSIVVRWSAVSSAVSYQIRRADTPDYSTSVEIGTVSTPPYIDMNAVPDKPYYYWVLPVNDSGVAYHDESKFTTGLRVQNPATATVVLKKGWNLCPVSAGRLSDYSKNELRSRFRLFQYDQSRRAYIYGTLEGYDSFWLYAEEPETLILEVAQ
ncbi:MAG: leucine-rich repeat protein [Victivallales bacterium]|nr:leucine-rich repeat protein [Victivallales bacterium]